MPTKARPAPVESLTPSNENSVLDFALLIIAITPQTIDASASPKVTTMSIAARFSVGHHRTSARFNPRPSVR